MRQWRKVTVVWNDQEGMMTRRKPWRFSDRDVKLTIIGVFVGGLLGWAQAYFYYRKGLSDSEATVAEQNKTLGFIMRGIESVGTINYVRDATGIVTGVSIQLRGSASDTTGATGDLTTGPGPSKK